MTVRGQHTLSEIISQPNVWAETIHTFMASQAHLKQAWTECDPKQLLFTGCGSTYYLAQTAAALFQSLTGIAARAYPASEIALFAPQLLINPEQTLMVAISRSGTTTETLAAVEKFRQLGGQAVWAIACYPQADLVQAANLALVAEAAQEQSMAQTRSFASMLILAQALAATIAGEDISVLARLPQLVRSLIEQAGPLAETLGYEAGLKQFFFLGSGPQYGLACEAMLKMKEMSISHSEAFHFLEFRHGPKSLIDEQSLVVGLLSPAAFIPESQVLSEMPALGGQTLALNPLPDRIEAQWSVNLASDLPTWARLALYLPPLQLLAYHRAISKALDPDTPRHLSAVVFLDGKTLTPG
jgi:glucosamine--fructose-6-phosphate aminotransferase (isomerizing)